VAPEAIDKVPEPVSEATDRLTLPLMDKVPNIDRDKFGNCKLFSKVTV